ncbi:MAG: acyl-CoA/acyl-ACP dehydrogenase [Thaumarchaeota archaeon]|nr:acyl-CoA/acyl-ACP dehydrogenase [Candidatus Calditenuaceae archaeon]MDW8186760.1 acyl-CoA dehydrogenase family protein [Nitrososphaerota archaeon]
MGHVSANVDFSESPAQRVFRDSVREFCKRYVEPVWIDIDERGLIESELIWRMAENGVYALTISEAFGGQGGTFTEAAIAGEELAYHAPALSLAVLFIIQSSWPYTVQLYGSEEAKLEVLPEVAKGRAAIGIASTEAHGGSDVSDVRLQASRDGSSWILRGEKSMVSLPRIIETLPWGGGWFTVARTGDPRMRHNTITDFLVLMKSRGVRDQTITYKPWTEIGRKGLDTSVITFENTRVDDVFRIGEVNGGFRIAMEGFNLARSMIGAITVGCAKWLLDSGRDWIRHREVFGRPIASYQSISFRFADLAKELEAARLLCYKAAWVADRYYVHKDGSVDLGDVALYGAMAKLKCASLAVEIGQEVMKWFGGAAYFKETPVLRAWLGALSYVLGAEGTENMMRLIIARRLIGRDYV